MPFPPFSGTPSLLDPDLSFPLTQLMQSGTAGPFERGFSKYWITPVYLFPEDELRLAAYRSDDNGLTFSLISPGFDTAAPIAENSYSTYYPDDGGDTIYIGMRLGATGSLHAVTFDMSTDTFIDVSDSGVTTALAAFYQNQIVKLPGGNLVIFYGAGTVDAIVWNGVMWSSPVSIGAGPASDFVDVAIVNGDGNACILWDNSSAFFYTILTGTSAGAPISAGAIPSGYQRSFSFLEINCSFYDQFTDSFVLGYQHGPSGAGNTLSLLIGTTASAPTFRTVDVQIDTGGIYDWQANAIATDGAGNYTFIAWGTVTLAGPTFQDAIYMFTATDLDGPWSLATDPDAVYYNIETDPPSPPPDTTDLNPLYIRYLGDGNVGVTFGSIYNVVTSPPTEIPFCGVLAYLPDTPTPPPTQTLELTKIVSGGTASPTDFLLSAIGGSPETEISGAGHVGPTEVSPGVYELSETSTSSPSWGDAIWGVDLWGGDYSPQPWDCGDAEMPTPTSVVVPEGGTVACSITNVFVPTPPPPGPGNGQANPVGCFELLRVDVTLMPSRHLPTRGSVR